MCRKPAPAAEFGLYPDQKGQTPNPADVHNQDVWTARTRSMPNHPPARVVLLILAYVGFVSLGLPDAVLGIAWPSLRAEFEAWGARIPEIYSLEAR